MSELLLVNANVITMNPAFPRARTIRIRDGGIASVSAETPSHRNRPGAKTEVIDCQGKTVVPGFIDPHCHLAAYARSFVTLDLGPRNVSSISDIQNLIKRAARKLPPGTWIMGRGCNEFYLAEKRHPDRWDLDAVSPAHPVRISHRSGHAQLLNSLALKHVGISLETGDPPDGLIDRNLTTGEPTGMLYGMDKTIAGFFSDTLNNQAEEGIGLAGRALGAQGITSIHDASAGNDASRLNLLRAWQLRGDIPQRVSMLLGWEAFQKFREDQGANRSVDHRSHGVSHDSIGNDYNSINNDYASIKGVKIIIHEITGQLSPGQSELNEMVLQIHQAGLQAVLHAIEEKHVMAACTAIEHALKVSPAAGHRHRVEHCSVCPPALAKRLAAAGVMVVTQPAFLYYNGERYLKTVPEGDFKHLYPVATLMRYGVRVAGSSDFPIVPPDPLVGIYGAVIRKAENGAGILPAEGITPLEALSLFTVNAARATCTETTRGSIEPGKLADLALLSGDPTGLPEEEIKDIRVDMTVINGQVIWEKK